MQQRDRVCAEPVGGPECPKWQTHTSSTRAGSRPISPAQVKHILVWELVFSLKIMFWYQTFLILKVLSWGLERWLSGSGHLLLLQRGSGFNFHQFAATTWWFMTSVIPVPKNPALSSDVHRHQACMCLKVSPTPLPSGFHPPTPKPEHQCPLGNSATVTLSCPLSEKSIGPTVGQCLSCNWIAVFKPSSSHISMSLENSTFCV